MVNTWEILAEKERSARAPAPVAKDRQMDDDLLILDIANQLEFDPDISAKLLQSETARQDITEHVKAIYEAQGLQVSKELIESGMKAFESGSYKIASPKKSFSTRLARLYINRRKWLPLLLTLLFIFGSVAAINYVGFVRPQQIENNRINKLLGETLPQNLETAHAQAISIAGTDALKSKADDMRALGRDAIQERQIAKAEKISSDLAQYAADLSQVYQLRIVSRPGEYSGVFRINEDGGRDIRNYYLIVEAIGPDGDTVKVPISSEEDQASIRTHNWGIRVPEQVFNAVAADKADDQIIQNAIIGVKKRGFIQPEFSIETSGGYILDW